MCVNDLHACVQVCVCVCVCEGGWEIWAEEKVTRSKEVSTVIPQLDTSLE